MNRTGAIVALLDIYQKAVADLQKVIADIPDDTLAVITDSQTQDENCKSLQSILSHVVHSAYGYATSISGLKEGGLQRKDKIFHPAINEYQQDLEDAFNFTESVLQKFSDSELRQLNDSLKIKTGWGQLYDIEQLTEHAIVHILRHKRQIEQIKSSISNSQ